MCPDSSPRRRDRRVVLGLFLVLSALLALGAGVAGTDAATAPGPTPAAGPTVAPTAGPHHGGGHGAAVTEGSVSTDDGGSPAGLVRECGVVLDEAGRYLLVGDLRSRGTDACLTVGAADVVLDGRGHRVVGTGGNGTGILLGAAEGTHPSNVTVRNVAVEGFERGLYRPFGGPRTTGLTVRNVTVRESTTAVALRDVADLRMVNSTVTGNEHGVSVEEFGRGVEVRDNRIAGSRATGLTLFEGGAAPVVAGNTVTDNGRGITASNDIEDPAFVGNRVVDNRGVGIDIDRSYDARVRDNRVAGNAGPGISLADGDGRITANDVLSNAGPGVRVVQGAVTVTDNRLVGNGGDGVRLDRSDARITDNLVRASAGAGIRVDEGWALVSGNLVLAGGGDGVVVVGSGSRETAPSRVLDNRIVDNCGVAIRFRAGTAVVLENTVRGNAGCE